MIQCAIDMLEEGIENLVFDDNDKHMEDIGDDVHSIESEKADFENLDVISKLNNDATTLPTKLDRDDIVMIYRPICL